MTAPLRLFCLMLLFVAVRPAFANPAPFDLIGPTLDVKVTHAGATLPISETPNLSDGDQLWIKADLPPGQSVRYLLVAAFLRGATNPPPKNWFYRSETWSPKGADGLRITVPKGAQQVLVFLAPQTGGDFDTLVGAVRGRPGAFVRASQDLNQVSLDRSRLDAYLAAIRETSQTDPDRLKTVSPLLARSLAIKLNPDCLEKMAELQASCLMQGQDTLVLNDGHSASIVQALAYGETVNLIQELSLTQQAGFGYYSPYVGAVVDIGRILDSFHTAQYQYIPALTTMRGEQLSLLLNTPPSFHNPMSVLVVALPAVEPPQPPPLEPIDPKQAFCAANPELVLPIGGAPLTFSTNYAHDMVLRVKGAGGAPIDLPVKADAQKGGFIVNTAGFNAASLGDALVGSLHGYWGFAPFDGPSFNLRSTRHQHWELAADNQQSLIVGRDAAVDLDASETACVERVTLRLTSGETEPVDWKSVQPDRLAITAPLTQAQPGPVMLLIKQYGDDAPDQVPLEAFAQAGHLESFDFHAGDLSGVLKGARLDEVTGLTFKGVAFKPAELKTAGGADELSLVATDALAAEKLAAGEAGTAKVALKDGRIVGLRLSVEPLRPSAALISKTIQPNAANDTNLIQLTDKDELPLGAVLRFSIHAQAPTTFSGRETIEVASIDGSVLATLSLASGLVLEDSHVAVATLDTAKAFGASTFGALQFRIVDDGTAGNWQPLATLVRLPVVSAFKCPATPGQGCELAGANLFLINSISSDANFDHALKVPEGFTGFTLPAPRPSAGRLYVELRDDPTVVNLVALEACHRRATCPATTRISPHTD